MSLRPALTMLQRGLVKPNFRRTDPKLWDRLIHLVELHFPPAKSQRGTGFNLVTRLKLHHPTTPNADPILQACLLLPREPSPYVEHARAQKAIALDIMQAIVVLKSKQRNEDARSLVKIAKHHLQADLLKKVESAYAGALSISITVYDPK